MDRSAFKTSASIIVILAMIFSVLGVTTLYNPEWAYAASSTDAKASGNTVKIPKKMGYGKPYTITVIGDRHADLYKRYQSYVAKKTGEPDSSVIHKDDVSMFYNGESIYKPIKMTVAKYGYYPKITRFKQNRDYTILDAPVYSLSIPKNFGAGKYTINTEFVKCTVDIIDNEYSPQEVYFISNTSSIAKKTNTFYVASKVKLAYNSKKGKLAKSKRTKYLNPTTKFGKLPKPIAKKGYKFIGWYSKNTGGKKITKNTKVPTKNTQTIYARYKKK